jgi:hypothetical protein
MIDIWANNNKAVPGGFYEDDGRSELEIHCPEHGGEAAQHGGEPSPVIQETPPLSPPAI